MDLSVSGPDGKPVRPIMGSCGHDHRGLPTQGDGVPAAVAPFEAVVVVAQQDDAAVAGMGEQEYRRLLDAGVDTIIDDRPVRAGVKFSDAELAGIPFRVTIGKRGLAAGNAEVSDRAAGEAAAVALDEIAGHVRKTVAHAIAGRP
jgi:prolyl-tRNA synthetase